jgi:hypothetical protein
MNGKEDVQAKQGSEQYRGVEEKIKDLEQPHADAGEQKGVISFGASGKARPVFGTSVGNGCRGVSLEPFCSSSSSALPRPME